MWQSYIKCDLHEPQVKKIDNSGHMKFSYILTNHFMISNIIWQCAVHQGYTNQTYLAVVSGEHFIIYIVRLGLGIVIKWTNKHTILHNTIFK